MYLGIHGDRSVTIGEIASRHGISRNHVMKVVHELGQLGYLQTIRGKNGGIRLGRLPEQINVGRSEEHTSELPSLMRNSYAVFCLKKKTTGTNRHLVRRSRIGRNNTKMRYSTT